MGVAVSEITRPPFCHYHLSPPLMLLLRADGRPFSLRAFTAPP